MAPRLRVSLIWKLVFASAVIVLVGMAVVLILANPVAAREVRGFVIRGGMHDSTLVIDALTGFYRDHGTWQGVESMPLGVGTFGHWTGHMGGMARMMAGLPGPALTLVDTQGHVISSPLRGVGETLSHQELASAIPIEVQGSVAGYLLPEGSGFVSPQEDLIAGIRQATWLSALAAAAAALLVAGMLALGLLRPVRELTEAARGLAAGDLSRRVHVRTRDELGDLSAAFNQMAASLERGEQLRKEMTADIAHELRNPLAVMQARLEAVIDGVYPSTGGNLAPILEQSRLLNRLVEDLRTLALVDSGELSLEKTEVDLGGVAGRVVESHQARARSSGITLRLEAAPEGELLVSVDPMRVEQVLGNLLDNALRHTGEGGEVIVRALRNATAKTAQVDVMDSGEGIDPEALPCIFERFYRADQARSRQAGGSGLGLSIARKLVEANGGTIRAANRAQRGAVFSVEFPLLES